MSRKWSLLFLLLPVLAVAENTAPQPTLKNETVVTTSSLESPISAEISQPIKLQANVALHTLGELQQLLEQAEVIANGDTQYNTEEPIAVVLHGEEIKAFLRSNYRTNKSLVDLAARLDAFNVIEVKVCKRWMGANGIMVNDLPPFVEAVPFGAGERERLESEGYAYF